MARFASQHSDPSPKSSWEPRRTHNSEEFGLEFFWRRSKGTEVKGHRQDMERALMRWNDSITWSRSYKPILTFLHFLHWGPALTISGVGRGLRPPKNKSKKVENKRGILIAVGPILRVCLRPLRFQSISGPALLTLPEITSSLSYHLGKLKPVEENIVQMLAFQWWRSRINVIAWNLECSCDWALKPELARIITSDAQTVLVLGGRSFIMYLVG